jgi:alkylhydroperoxidase/carboxymuconolactone decarboxylase family protein YurZ
VFPPALVDPETGEQVSPWWGVFEKYDPDGWAAYQEWFGRQAKPEDLDKRLWELIIVAIDSLVAWPSPYIDLHIHGAFNEGASIQEVVDAILAAGGMGGGHALNHGFTALAKVLAERDEAGETPPATHG